MDCPYCGQPHSNVIDSRKNRRRRECSLCKRKWTTYELTKEEIDVCNEDRKRLIRILDIIRTPYVKKGGKHECL